jgi:hypothetical protein
MTEEIKQHPKTLAPALSRWEREFDVVLLAPSSITHIQGFESRRAIGGQGFDVEIGLYE